MDISKATVLVTGGSSGIGQETARRLIAGGAKVAICARDKNKLERAAADIGAFAIQADVSKEDDVKRMVGAVINEFGNYNVLINNAAYGYFSPLTEIDLEEFNRVLATNVVGAMLVARESAKYFIRKNYGNIVNISSTAGSRGYASGTPYVATKFALGGMTQCWLHELRRYNIRVMQVNPSEVLTNFGSTAGYSQKPSERKLRSIEIAQVITNVLELDDRGFVTDLTVWATNPD